MGGRAIDTAREVRVRARKPIVLQTKKEPRAAARVGLFEAG